jgi:hypothetical protein
MGERALGLVAAQLLEITRWIKGQAGVNTVRLEVSGMRSQVAAHLATALEPGLCTELVIREGIPSLSYLLEKPVEYREASELFCLDLYRDFDIDRLTLMAEPVKVTFEK